MGHLVSKVSLFFKMSFRRMMYAPSFSFVLLLRKQTYDIVHRKLIATCQEVIVESYFDINVHSSQKACQPTFEKWVLHDMTHMKDTHTKYLSTILTVDFASVCLDTSIQTDQLTGQPRSNMHFLGALEFPRNRVGDFFKRLYFLLNACEFVGASGWNPDGKYCQALK